MGLGSAQWNDVLDASRWNVSDSFPTSHIVTLVSVWDAFLHQLSFAELSIGLWNELPGKLEFTLVMNCTQT